MCHAYMELMIFANCVEITPHGPQLGNQNLNDILAEVMGTIVILWEFMQYSLCWNDLCEKKWISKENPLWTKHYGFWMFEIA